MERTAKLVTERAVMDRAMPRPNIDSFSEAMLVNPHGLDVTVHRVSQHDDRGARVADPVAKGAM